MNYMPTEQDLHKFTASKRSLFISFIKLLLELLHGNGRIGRHAVVLGGFLDLLLHVNPLVSDRWIDDLYLS
jgi:hypothetical protein